MAGSKNTVIFYQNQIKICKKHLTSEQFGRLMAALFELDEGGVPEVDDDIALAFEFMSVQQQVDREKYEKRCAANRKNGKKGGRPKKNPQNPNGFFKNPNEEDDEDEDDEIMMNDDEATQHSVPLGKFKNVELTEGEYFDLKSTYERSGELIDKVSTWLRGAEYDVPDHYALCIRFADNDEWPKRKVIEPVELPKVEDPLTEEEQAERMSQMKKVLGGMFEA